jgi:hypothetical protein
VARVWETIAAEAAAGSPVWADALVPEERRAPAPVFSVLAPNTLALGVETIYEGYLVHYGTSRLFEPPDADTALLLGDYLYANGLVHVAETGDVSAVAELAELIALCAQSQAEGRAGDGVAWAATCAELGAERLEGAHDELRLRGDTTSLEAAARAAAGDHAVDEALAAHATLVG